MSADYKRRIVFHASHLYKYFRFSKCHLTPCRSSKIDQMRKTRCVKAYSFAEVLSLEVSTIKYAFNSLFAIHRIYKICTYSFFKVNNGEEVSFKALELIRESDFLLC